MVVNNPNNWHWVDKNCIDWTKSYFNEKLVGVSAGSGDSFIKVASVSSVEGDVEVCQRKGKVISLFDLRLILNLEGKCTAEKEVKGSVTVPELAYDSEADDIQFDISIYNEDADSEKSRLLTRKELVPKLREILHTFGSDLISTHGSGIQLELDKVNLKFTKENQTSSVVAPKTETPKPKTAPASNLGKSSAPQKATSYNTSTLHLEPTFNTTAEQLYLALLDKDRVSAWTRSACQIDAFPPSEKSEFKIFGGSVEGVFTKLVPNERIVQNWRLSDWRTGHYAVLDISLKQGAGETTMVVKWLGIPIGEEDRVRGNFEDYYVRSMKITFGFGAVL